MADTYRSIFHTLYKNYGFDKIVEDVVICQYCDDKATGKDHVPPLKFARDWINRGEWKTFETFKYYTTPCCEWCNKKLLAKPLLTIEARKEYIKQNPKPEAFIKSTSKRGRKRIPESYGFYVNLDIRDVASAVKILQNSGEISGTQNVSTLFRTMLAEWLAYQQGEVKSLEEAYEVLRANSIPIGNQATQLKF